MGLTIGVDIGGTKIAAGVVDAEGAILDQVRVATPRNAADTAEAIAAAVRAVRQGHQVEAVGLGAAGFIDEQRATVLFAPNVAWVNEPLRAEIEKLLDDELPVVVENDANAAAWGEYRFGAGRGEGNLLCITLGTGIGGGIVIDGGLYRGRFGIAAEFGHMRVVPDGRRCGCGNKGCWEMYASGNALVREARDLAASGSPLATTMLAAAGGTIEGITGQVITLAAQQGDPSAGELFEGLGAWVGAGIASLVALFDPGRVVLGGGVSEAGDLLLVPTQAAFRRALTGRGHRPEAEIRLAELGNRAGLVGAADLARHR
jgi:glucokinase